MDIEHIVVLSRSAERILVALIGAFAIFLGYRLFASATVDANAVGLLKLGDHLQIDISHVGPGVFFALFGTSLICYAVVPVTYQKKKDGGEIVTKIRSMTDAWSATVEPALSALPCEASVKRLAEMAREIGPAPTDERQKELAVALREARVSLMCRSWKDEWGRREAFMDWVYNFGEGDPPSQEINRAVAVYRGSA
jgi:hypothetical protein